MIIAKDNIEKKHNINLIHNCFVVLVIVISSLPVFAGEAAGVSAQSSTLNLNNEGPRSAGILIQYISSFDFESLRLAVTDLIDTFGSRYPKGQEYLQRLKNLEQLCKPALNYFQKGDDSAKLALSRVERVELAMLADELKNLQYEALLSNPLLDFDKLLLLKRKRGQLGLPTNHQCNTALQRTGYDN